MFMVTMAGSSRLKDLWMWDREYRGVTRLWSFVGAAALTAGLSLVLGAGALFFLLFALMGPFLNLIYGAVGKRVEALKAALADEKGEAVECLMHNRNLQSPGIAVLREHELMLVPIVGDPVTVPLDGIRSVKEPRTLFGKGVAWKRVFVLEVDASPRLGFAVPEPVARRWRPRLTGS